GNPGGVVYNPQRKELVTVWEENGANAWDVWYRVLRLTRDANGVVTGFDVLPAAAAVTAQPKTQGVPVIALDPNTQSYLIVFQGDDPNSASLAVMLKTMDAATYALSGLIYANKGGYPVEASVVYLPAVSQFAVYWRQDADIVGRRFTPVSGA